MQSAAAIRDAARRLDDAFSVFRMKSRSMQEDHADLNAHWNDARARQFAAKHLDPQRELMEHGARLCQLHGNLVDSAGAAAQEAEQEISGFFSAQSAYESSTDSARQSTSLALDLASRSRQDSARVSRELTAINASIAAAAADPGW